jgi:nicotinate-nucleotide adenylyltransferase
MIGILGGTFDPVHNGHLRTALDVQQGLGLDELRLIPLRDPPHREQPLCSTAQRLEMLQAAVANEPNLSIDERELNRSGKSYSLLTLQSLREELGDVPICLVIGQDAFQEFPTWHKPDEIFRLAHLVVMQRPGEKQGDLYPDRLTDDASELQQRSSGKIYQHQVTQLEISSTGIREMIRKGRSPRYLVPESVLEIIERDGLYRQ